MNGDQPRSTASAECRFNGTALASRSSSITLRGFQSFRKPTITIREKPAETMSTRLFSP